MGLDGGVKPTRNDVLRRSSALVAAEDNTRSTRGGAVTGVYKRRKLDPAAERVVRWTTCTLSGEPLAAPVVSDFLGALYNKGAVLEFLLARQGSFQGEGEAGLHRHINQLRTMGEALQHLQSARDVFAVHLMPSSTSSGADGGDAGLHHCPVLHLPCTTGSFAALSTCGHVLSERAIKELRAADGSLSCPVCSTSCAPEALVPINGSDEQVAALREALPRRRGSKKKGGKRGKQSKEGE